METIDGVLFLNIVNQKKSTIILSDWYVCSSSLKYIIGI